MSLYDPDAIYHCPGMLAYIMAYEFEPTSDNASIYGSCDPNPCMTGVKMNSELSVKGHWTGSPRSEFASFEPGLYTVVGGDEWGALAVLHFVVRPSVNAAEHMMFPPTTVRDVPTPASIPWRDVTAYTEGTYEINVNVDEEFAIGMFATMDFSFAESHDQNQVGLLDHQMVEYHASALNKYGTDWFLFKATKAGTTELVFQYPLEYTKLFKITIR